MRHPILSKKIASRYIVLYAFYSYQILKENKRWTPNIKRKTQNDNTLPVRQKSGTITHHRYDENPER